MNKCLSLFLEAVLHSLQKYFLLHTRELLGLGALDKYEVVKLSELTRDKFS